MHTYEYPRPAVTVDVVLCRKAADEREILLIQRKNDPFKGAWALPGGFVDEDEGLGQAACRELEEETAIAGVALEQFRAYGETGRDPRGHTVSIVYVGAVEELGAQAEARDDAAALAWFPISSLPSLAFDHGRIIEEVLDELFVQK